MFRFIWVPFFLFPATWLAVYVGGWGPVAFILGALTLHVLVDNATPAETGQVQASTAWFQNLLLFLQIPFSIVLLLEIGARWSPGAPAATWLASLLNLTFVPYQSAGEVLGVIALTGYVLGGNIVVAHELMHRKSRFWSAAGRALLILAGDAQFKEAHVYCHHANVATWKDPASARRGESLYRFAWRSTIGQYRESFAFEQRRLQTAKGSARLLSNKVVLGTLASVLLLGLWGYLFGAAAALSWLGAMAFAKLLLEAINYIQHYGLVRVPGTKVEARHSWDCYARAASDILFNLPRHADHHANALAPFWALRAAGGSPMLRHGYMFSLTLAFIPGLWFRYIRPYLEQWDKHLASPEEKQLVRRLYTEHA